MATVSLDEKRTYDEAMSCYNEWVKEIQSFQTLVNDCEPFLAGFDVRKAQSMIANLLVVAEESKAKMLPRKKFAFSSRRTAAAPAAPEKQEDVGKSRTKAPIATAIKEAAPNLAKFAVSEHLLEDEHTISDKKDVVIVIRPGEYTEKAKAELETVSAEMSALEEKEFLSAEESKKFAALRASKKRFMSSLEGTDLRLLNLTNCTVIILDSLRALRVDSLTNCVVISGPISGSVLLHTSKDCTLFLPARQFRLHTSSNCAFYLHALSRPIIEHCTGFRFAPYPLDFHSFKANMEKSKLNDPTQPDLWRQVDDFRWLRVQSSPNWSVMQPGTRIGEAASETGIAVSLESIVLPDSIPVLREFGFSVDNQVYAFHDDFIAREMQRESKAMEESQLVKSLIVADVPNEHKEVPLLPPEEEELHSTVSEGVKDSCTMPSSKSSDVGIEALHHPTSEARKQQAVHESESTIAQSSFSRKSEPIQYHVGDIEVVTAVNAAKTDLFDKVEEPLGVRQPVLDFQAPKEDTNPQSELSSAMNNMSIHETVPKEAPSLDDKEERVYQSVSSVVVKPVVVKDDIESDDEL